MRDTIAAIASGVVRAGISIIRVSGKDAVFIIDRIFQKKNGKKIVEQKSHTIHYGFIKKQDQIIDEVLIMYMKGPHSYTGEDTIEINCHGGMLVTRNILQLVLQNGARPAEPGEFTKRAFLNGRIDLSQAEAVIDVINSQNNFALESSVQQLKGALHDKIEEIRKKIIYEVAFIESALDDPEHYSTDGYADNLKVIVEEQIKKIEALMKTSENGKILKEGINTVIVGKPNVGKSSLLNLLIGEEKAIVTDIAGTTRDILEQTILLDGIQLNVIDTAGIRKTNDAVEKIGVEKTIKYTENADLILYLIDGSQQLDNSDYQIMDMLKDKKVIVLLNKSDLVMKVTEEEVKKNIDKKIISISAKEKAGIDLLEREIQQLFFQEEIDFNSEVYITNARHLFELDKAKICLEMVLRTIEDNMPEDFFSIDLTDAYQHLGNIIGESMDEDLVDEIFNKFCMGK